MDARMVPITCISNLLVLIIWYWYN